MHPSLVRGGEPTWQLVNTPGLVPIPYEYFGRAVLGTPHWDWRKFDFDKDVTLATQKTGEVLDAINPDLSRFKSQGGKLIHYHGWNDQVIFPAGQHQLSAKRRGQARARKRRCRSPGLLSAVHGSRDDALPRRHGHR